ncbi:response regulator transcription factor [Pleionea sediminis]|uniref:response regulator transcription factor n=1 Tax=Pleionea sediminis TaxID=2569479 RepID=UPI00197BC630|nr:helix-turn-helix transcriptional regulator [Pleionea sediminis]
MALNSYKSINSGSNNHPNILSAVKQNNRSVTPELINILFDEMRALGFDRTFVTSRGPAQKCITNMSKNETHLFFDQEWLVTNRTLKMSTYHRPTIWQELDQSKHCVFFLSKLRTLGLYNGLSFTVYSNRGQGIFHLSCDETIGNFSDYCRQRYTEIYGLAQLYFVRLVNSHPSLLFELPKLTPRENECLNLLSKGLSNPEMSKLLSISKDRVKELVSSIIRKLDASNRTEAVLLATRCGIL